MAETQSYVSPVAEPVLDGKVLKRTLKLIRLAAENDRQKRSKKNEGVQPTNTRKSVKLLRRGVQEVTKSIRKGEIGVVFLATDVYPIEIAAHLPVLCEENDMTYAYVCPKKSLGGAFCSKRPASVLMVTMPPKEGGARENDESPVYSTYQKVVKTIRKDHPYL